MKNILVLGGYGLIGEEVMRHLVSTGFTVTGLGRSRAPAQKVSLPANWIIRDLASLGDRRDWDDLLAPFDAIVNCAGALQDGPRDHLEAVHVTAVKALAASASDTQKMIVQISAAGVGPDASTAFFRTKAQGDEALLESGARVVILKPGLVLAPKSYGGTGLIRQIAAFPFVQPIAMPDAPVQTVSVTDVARAVERALTGVLPDLAVLDLVEDAPHRLTDVVAAHRRWLGFPKARAMLPMPDRLVGWVAKIADALGYLGWRSPLRSTAIEVLKTGVAGDPAPYRKYAGALSSLDETLGTFTAGSADRLQARTALIFPIAIIAMSLFWIVSGVVGLVSLDAAGQVLQHVGWSEASARLSVAFWAVIDIALGLMILHRKWAKTTLLGMLVTSAIYLIAASVVVPGLWLDPLGPLVKIVPAMLAVLFLFAPLEER